MEPETEMIVVEFWRTCLLKWLTDISDEVKKLKKSNKSSSSEVQEDLLPVSTFQENKRPFSMPAHMIPLLFQIWRPNFLKVNGVA